jgi:uncharacterized protein (DUF433 family)
MPTLLDTLKPYPPPLVADVGGIVRVGGTRVTLQSVISAFHSGCAPEEILLKFPSLKLTDIYSVLTYYLWHRSEIDRYLAEQSAAEDATRREVEQRCPPTGFREALLRRRDATG